MITFGLAKHEVAAIAHILVSIGARHVQHAGTTEGGETVGGSSRGGGLSTSGARPR